MRAPFFTLLAATTVSCGTQKSLNDLDGDGFTEEEGDCDDASASVSPAISEVLDNGVDDDCNDGADEWDLDEDGYFDAADPVRGEEGVDAGLTDCDDADPTVHPDADEDCEDGIDNDCEWSAECYLWEGATLDATTVRVWEGGTPGGRAGSAVAAGSWGPKGLGMVAVGSPSAGEDYAGAVSLVPWSSTLGAASLDDALATLEGLSGERLGSAMDVSDVNGDGSEDLAIGAPGASGAAGSVYVLLDPSIVVETRAVGDEADLIVSGQPGDGIGRASQAWEGLLVLGGPGASRAWIVPPDSGEIDLSDEIDGVALIEDSHPTQLGAALATPLVGARPWLALGAPNAGESSGCEGPEAGMALLFEEVGGASLADDAELRICGEAGYRLGSSFGTGDLDDDGEEELLVGAPDRDEVWVLSGDDLEMFASEGRLLGREEVAQLLVGPSGSGFGEALSVVDDLDGDGLLDVLVGAPDAEDPDGLAVGAAWLLLSAAETPLEAKTRRLGTDELVFWGASDGASLGSALGMAPDMDGDTNPELIFGAPGVDIRGRDDGAMLLMRGNGE